jgi:hypothetical protein
MVELRGRDVQHSGRALFRTAEPPDAASFVRLRSRGIEVEPLPAEGVRWAVTLDHPAWGTVMVARDDLVGPPPALELSVVPGLTRGERSAVLAARSALYVALPGLRPGRDVLRDRKALLWWTRVVLGSAGVAGYDDGAGLVWSRAALEEELAHDAPLDVAQIYTVHLVHRPGATQLDWVHTHGLEAAGAFDFDLLRPGLDVLDCGPDVLRILAREILRGRIARDTPCHGVVLPDGFVSFVPVEEFMRDAAASDSRLRDAPATHAGRRSVVCDPRDEDPDAPPRPSSVFSAASWDGWAIGASEGGAASAADRALRTFPMLRSLSREFAKVDVRARVELAVPRDGGGAGQHECLWFHVHAFRAGAVDATLLSTPVHVAGLPRGQRAWRSLDALTDWRLITPIGDVTPWSGTAARMLREDFAAREPQPRRVAGCTTRKGRPWRIAGVEKPASEA